MTCIASYKSPNPRNWGLFASLLLATLSFSCSQDSTKFIPRKWHDLNSKYNSYFLAREAVQAVEKDIFDNRVENYNRVLDVFAYVDTNYLQKHDTKLEDAIKKSANVPNRHQNSEWLYPSYLMIGKARHYRREYENAISTFKYVNTKSEDPHTRNQALIELMRTYIQVEDFRSAKAAMEALRKRRLSKTEKRDFFLMRAHLYRELNDMLETAKSLGSALKSMPHGEAKARAHFALAQIYQLFDRNARAYQNYKQVINNNPRYELYFYARLYMAQVSELSDESDVKKIMRYFRRLLNDEKNAEFQDKIYYEMALFELRRDDLPEALRYLNQSVLVSENKIQKAYSFLKLGEIHYADLKQYEAAKTYYDSVMTFLPENVENYKAIKKRHEGLEEFVNQLNIYRTQDSLQRLYRMPEAERVEYITQQLTLEENRLQDQEDSLALLRASLKKSKKTAPGTLAEVGKSNEWYFYNPSNVRIGQEAFIERFGRRPLVDNWRRRDALQGALTLNDTSSYVEVDPAIFRAQEIQKRVERRKKVILEAIPKDENDIQASNKKIEDAAYEIGRIYYFKLEEPENAIEYFEILLNRFPKTRYQPEVMYFLYLLYQDLGRGSSAEQYKQKLIRDFPNSQYTKRIINPNWDQEALKNQAEVKAAYRQAYSLFEIKQYSEALGIVQEILIKYPNNLIEDKLAYLQILLDIKLLIDRKIIQKRLQEFIKKYPSSDLLPQAQQLSERVQ